MDGTRHRGLAAVVAAIALTAGLAAGPARADDGEVASRFAGRWEYAGDEGEQQARLDAIEAAVQGMPRFFRAFARKVMRGNMTNPPAYVIEVDEGRVGIGPGADDLFWTPLDGTAAVGEGYEAERQTKRWIEGDELRDRSWQHNGSGTHHFRLSSDGQRLTVSVIISSQRLEDDVRYQLTYRRAD